MNSHTVSEAKNHNFIYSTHKSDENNQNRSEMENTGLQDGVDIDIILTASKNMPILNTIINIITPW